MHLIVKVRGVLGGGEGDSKEVTLYRIVRYGTDHEWLAIVGVGGSFGARGKHHQNARSETCRSHQDTEFTKHQESMDEAHKATDLSEDYGRTYRGGCVSSGRARHFVCSQGDGKVDVSAKHHGVGNGTEMRGRYFLGKARMVQRFVTQLSLDRITMKIDSDHAGCLRTRKSTTGIADYHGKHVIKAAPTTQTVIALSSGESQFYAAVRGTATALGMKFMVRDCGHEVRLHWKQIQHLDVALPLRLGAAKVRHVNTQWLWVQGVFHRREATIRETPRT